MSQHVYLDQVYFSKQLRFEYLRTNQGQYFDQGSIHSYFPSLQIKGKSLSNPEYGFNLYQAKVYDHESAYWGKIIDFSWEEISGILENITVQIYYLRLIPIQKIQISAQQIWKITKQGVFLKDGKISLCLS
ncbi:MAG TPA: hypothetical protein PLQ36_01100, partial [Candidatus Gracilibacteria bacterium]|nr:hypothetical protein [Candidatus Gracilibacteria bacterium]